MQLAGLAAVVTGATEGIGRAIAQELGKAGMRIAICARTEPRVRETVAELRGAGIDAVGIGCDVADPGSVARFAQFVQGERGTPAVVVNNAGIGRFKPIEELSLDDWDATMAVNVRSLFLVTRAFLAGMKAARSGAVVNIASLAGKNGIDGGTAYCASKHAVLGFSKSLMLELRKHDIRVIAVCPGSVATPFMDKNAHGRANRDRVLRPEDVASTVLSTLTLPDRAMISELDLRPTNP
jgi:3-oxoacyl-[acyl-carrier protein] reductase